MIGNGSATIATGIAVGVAVVLAGAGCARDGAGQRDGAGDRNPDRSGVTHLYSSPAVVRGQGLVATVPEDALDALAAARCAREVRCRRIGPGALYTRDAECAEGLRRKNRRELVAVDCQGGPNEHVLEECLDAIRGAECEAPLDALGDVPACRPGRLCSPTP